MTQKNAELFETSKKLQKTIANFQVTGQKDKSESIVYHYTTWEGTVAKITSMLDCPSDLVQGRAV